VKPLTALVIGLLALAGPARAQTTPPAAPPTCGVARDPQLVSPAGVLHVLDHSGSQILRWSLPANGARPPLSIDPDAVAFGYLAEVDKLVIARPGGLTLRSLVEAADEEEFVTFGAEDGELCGLATTERHVIACVSHNHYLVFDSSGELVADADVGDADPSAASWDAMAWDGATRTLYATRTQGTLLGAIALPIDENGALGEPSFAEPNDPNTPHQARVLSLLPDGTRLIAPDGLILSTDPFAIAVAPKDAPGDAFAIGDEVFSVGDASGTACALSTHDGALAAHALISSGTVRTAERNGRVWLLHGDGATAALSELHPGTGDLDRDHALDGHDFFPLEPVSARDWDRDGVDDKHDALPTKVADWLDTDGDRVGDSVDAFPKDLHEWVDSDLDGVGDHADAFPDRPTETLDSDSDGKGDNEDAFKLDPLEQEDADEDGFGDNGEFEFGDPLGTPMASFDVEVKRAARLSGFASSLSTSSQVLTLFDNDRFALCALADCLTGSFERTGRAGTKLKLHFDIASRSRLEPVFAAAGAEIVAADTADPPSPTLSFVPKSVTSDGVAKLTKQAVTLSLRVTFAYKRAEVGARGTRGAFVYRAKGTPEE